MPCAVCQSSGIGLMVPGRVTCPHGFSAEYSGWLMSSPDEDKKQDYVCVDSSMQFKGTTVWSEQAFTSGTISYTLANCGSLPCGPYADDFKIPCVQCTARDCDGSAFAADPTVDIVVNCEANDISGTYCELACAADHYLSRGLLKRYCSTGAYQGPAPECLRPLRPVDGTIAGLDASGQANDGSLVSFEVVGDLVLEAISFASASSADPFVCVTVSLNEASGIVSCEIPFCVGADLFFSVRSCDPYNPDHCFLREANLLASNMFSCAMPTIEPITTHWYPDGTLTSRLDARQVPPDNIPLISFFGSNFPRYSSGGLPITIGLGPDRDPHRYSCNPSEHCTPTRIVCRPRGLVSGGNLSFVLRVSSFEVRSTDRLDFPNAAEIFEVRGCATNKDSATFDCPTTGLTELGEPLLLHIIGISFSSPQVFIGGLLCPLFNATGADISCELPPGTGIFKAVTVYTKLGFSAPYYMVSYSKPTIESIQADEGTSSNRLNIISIPRLAAMPGSIVRLTIHGLNFGPIGALVQLGTQQCNNAAHSLSNPHRTVTCNLPNGSDLNLPLTLLQRGGLFSQDLVTVSYQQCPTGTRADELDCVPCPAGRFSFLGEGNPSASVCNECSPGRYEVDRSRCQDCEVGYAQPKAGKGSCYPCAPGFASPTSAGKLCLACNEGTFSHDNLANVACSPCEPGYAQSESQSMQCTACGVGFKSEQNTGSKRCMDCVPGTYSAMPFNDRCLPCPPGRAQSNTTSSLCDACRPGFMSEQQIGSTRCLPCSQGLFSANDTNSICLPCTAGYAQPLTGAVGCGRCGSGFFAPLEDANKVCEICGAGTFSSGTANSDCSRCPHGRYQPAQGSSACLQCKGGLVDGDRTQCLKCQKNQILALPLNESEADQGQCVPCPDGVESNDERTACICGSGKYLSSNGFCQACPVRGADCRNRVGLRWDSIPSAKGWFQHSPLHFYRCQPGYCLGNNTCVAGRAGPVCSLCFEGYKPVFGQSNCVPCPSDKALSWTLTISVLGCSMLVFLFLSWLILRYDVFWQAPQQGRRMGRLRLSRASSRRSNFANPTLENAQPDTNNNTCSSAQNLSKKRVIGGVTRVQLTPWEINVALGQKLPLEQQIRLIWEQRVPTSFLFSVKIAFSFVQIAGSFVSMVDVPWPSYYVSFISTFNILQLEFIPWNAMSCVVSIDYYAQIYLVAAVPLVMLLLLSFLNLCNVVMDRRDLSDDASRRVAKRIYRTKVLQIILFLMFLVYPTVSQQALSFFDCREIEGIWYLNSDMSLNCFDEVWWSHFLSVIFIVVLYPIGIPLILFLLLFHNRRELNQARTQARIGILYLNYDRNRWFWEVLDMLYKLCMINLIFVPLQNRFMVGQCLCWMYFASVLVSRPYVRHQDDTLQLVAQNELMLILILTTVLVETMDNGAAIPYWTDLLLSILLMGLTVLIFCLLLFFTLAPTTRYLRILMRNRQRDKINSSWDVVSRADMSHVNLLNDDFEKVDVDFDDLVPWHAKAGAEVKGPVVMGGGTNTDASMPSPSLARDSSADVPPPLSRPTTILAPAPHAQE